jgi:type VI secretion system protein ImpI
VPIGLRLRVTSTVDGTFIERTFDRFPVRIGRNPLSDFELDSPYVSQFHCVLELHGRQLMLRDLGSRNGTHLRNSGRVPPHQLVDLGPSNYEFAISTLLFQAFPAEVAPPQSEQRPRMRGASVALDAETAEAMRLQMQGLGVQPNAAHVAQELKPHFDAYRAAWLQFFNMLSTRTASLDTHSRTQLLQGLAREHPHLANEPDFQRLAHFGQAELANSQHSANREATVALQAIKDLAASYLPNQPLEGPVDVVSFVTKLQSALDVFFKSFIPLRDGYKQFETKMEIRRPTVRASQIGQFSVETAADPKTLAAGILDWRDPRTDGPRQIESTFADLMIHQVAMLDGVMRGVKSLLGTLSPQAIESIAEKKNRGGWGPFKYESLWKTFIERHSDLADEEKETFELIFGKQFAQVYAQMSKEPTVGAGAGPFPDGQNTTGGNAAAFRDPHRR